jgi:hypothetical protein
MFPPQPGVQGNTWSEANVVVDEAANQLPAQTGILAAQSNRTGCRQAKKKVCEGNTGLFSCERENTSAIRNREQADQVPAALSANLHFMAAPTEQGFKSCLVRLCDCVVEVHGAEVNNVGED